MTIEEKIFIMREKLISLGEVQSDSTIETIQAACCAVFGVSVEELKGKARPERIANARMISMTLCRKLLPRMSLNQIGDVHGRKDHGTVLHGIRRVRDLSETDKDFKHRLEIVTKLIEETPANT